MTDRWWGRAAASALIFGMLAVAGCTNSPSDEIASQLIEEGRLTVGSNWTFKPFEFVEDGEPVGFDIDLMNEIASRLGLEPDYVDVPFDTLFDQLATGDFDVIISAITITPEREETIAFTDPYFAADQALAAAKGSKLAGLEDLGDQDVAVEGGTTSFEFAQRELPKGARIVEFPSTEASFAAVQSGQVDAVLTDLPVAAEQVKGNDGLEIVAEVETGELYGIGVQRDHAGLAAAINEQLAAIIADGTYAQLYSTWFAGPVPQRFRPAEDEDPAEGS